MPCEGKTPHTAHITLFAHSASELANPVDDVTQGKFLHSAGPHLLPCQVALSSVNAKELKFFKPSVFALKCARMGNTEKAFVQPDEVLRYRSGLIYRQLLQGVQRTADIGISACGPLRAEKEGTGSRSPHPVGGRVLSCEPETAAAGVGELKTAKPSLLSKNNSHSFPTLIRQFSKFQSIYMK
ncbi:hypothetical protein MG293_020240 [Ovis ammon polii]|uniref:Uncharacterized protein n=1 Tax=Ovis ammon polii TaxID=230172 RepID=A0AAD4TK44_OVIAM|nr:hypothetical protein MG293_020240 [Ovis ammon polii]